jgi:hypothetical protein
MSPRKSLFFGSAVLFLAVLFAFTGCDNPAGPKGEPGQDVTGDPGDTGAYGGFRLSLSANDVDLKEAFEQDTLVILLANVESVYGTVPPGGTLRVLGKNTHVEPGKKLELEGNAKLEIIEGGILWAIGLASDSGLLVSLNGTPQVTGEGRIYLPAVQTPATPTDFLHWESNAVVNVDHQYPGSFYDGKNITAFNSDSIALLLERLPELKIPSVVDLRAHAIPSGKKLTLLESGSEIIGAFTLNNGATLVVEGTGPAPGYEAGLEFDGQFSGGLGSVFIIGDGGTVDLGVNGCIVPGGPPASLTVTNDGTIITDMIHASPFTDLSTLLGLAGAGTIRSTTGFDYTGESAIVLKQNLFLDPLVNTDFVLPDSAAPFDDKSILDKTITIGTKANLVLDEDTTHIGYIDTTTPATPVNVKLNVVNNGTITTSTAASSTLTNIFESLQPNSAKEKGLVIADGVVELTGPFEIPALVKLGLDGGSATFGSDGSAGAAIRTLTINGTLDVGAANLEPPENVIINGSVTNLTGSIAFTAGKTVEIAASAEFKGTGSLIGDGTHVITIAGTEGYAFASAAPLLVANNYANALKAIEEAKKTLTDTVPLAGSLFPDLTEKVVGTVDLSNYVASTDRPIVKRAIATAAGDIVTLPTTPGNTDLIDITLITMGGDTIFNTSAAFIPSVVPATGVLQLRDTGRVVANPVDRFGVLEFQEYKIKNAGITSPKLVAPFHIGVKSTRP